MKKIFAMMGICILFLSATIAYSANIQGSVKSGVLMIIVDGFKNDKGFAKIALSNSSESYKNDAKAFMSKKVQIINSKAMVSLKDVPFGEYAIKVYHDENGNGQLDKSIFGKPIEAYGFSNNATAMFGRPDFKKAAFILDKAEMTITIHVE